MSLFKKKSEEIEKTACCCTAEATQGSHAETPAAGSCCGRDAEGICCVKVLGSGCASCHALYENACKAAKDAGLAVEVEYVTDMEKIMSYGVMRMPALVVNEKVVSAGKVLKAQDIQKILGSP